jgi:hypothetical protein
VRFFAARRSWNIRAGLPAGLPRETPTSPPDKAAPLEKEFTPHPRQEVHYEATPLSKHDPTRPIDCRTPSGRTSLVKVVAVFVDPRSVWKITPSIAERPLRTRPPS